MEIQDAVTTEEFHHQKEEITARIQMAKRINGRNLKDVQQIQTPEINQNSRIEIEDLIREEHIPLAGQVEIILALSILPLKQ